MDETLTNMFNKFSKYLEKNSFFYTGRMQLDINTVQTSAKFSNGKYSVWFSTYNGSARITLRKDGCQVYTRDIK